MRPSLTALLAAALLASPGVRAADAEKGTAALNLLKAIDDGFVAVFEKVAPAVVVIEATKRAEEDERDSLKGLVFFFEDGKDKEKKQAPSSLLRLPAPGARSEGSLHPYRLTARSPRR